MLIVLIDAFEEGKAEERRQFAAFENACRDAIDASGAGNVQVRVVPSGEIKKFIYNSDVQECSGTSGLKAFDRTDVFLIGCSANLLPWETAGQDLYILLKMCFFTKKCVFGAGGVAQFLGFLCAARGLDINPINGREGGSIDDINAHDMAARVEYPRRDVILDCASGDLYMLEHRKNRWVPYCSVGCRKKSRQHSAVRKHFVKVVDPSPSLYLSKSDETRCQVVKRHVQHPLFKNFDHLEFIVRNRPSWVLDPNVLRRAKHRPEILAENVLSPLVVQYYNFFAAQFDVSHEYPATITMLSNFMNYIARRMQHHGHLDLPSRVYLTFQSQTAKAEERINHNVVSRQQSKTKQAAPLKRSKSSIEMHSRTKAAQATDCVFLKQERAQPSLSRSKLNLEERKKATHGCVRPQSAMSRKTNYAENSHLQELLQREGNTGLLADSEQAERLRMTRQSRGQAVSFPTKLTRPRSAPNHTIRRASPQELAATLMSRIPPTHLYDRERHLPLEDLLQNGLTSTHTLRTLEAHSELAYPIGTNHANKSSPRKGNQLENHQTKDIAKGHKVPRLNIGQDPLPGGTINAQGPYKSKYDRERIDFLEGKRKWLHQKNGGFNHHIGHATRVQREDATKRGHVPQRDEPHNTYRPVAHHRFREEAKKAWFPA